MARELTDHIHAAGIDGGEGDPDAVLARARTLRRRRAITSAALPALALLVVAGLTLGRPHELVLLSPPEEDDAGDEEVEPAPSSPDAVIDPTLMEIDPALVPAGTVVDIHFPQGTLRGVCFGLELDVAGTWDARYVLHSSPGTAVVDREPTWTRLGDDAVVDCPDVDITGTDPDRVAVPADAPPGSYRVCTLHTPRDVCAELHVAGS